jgi:hypothetical protein
MDEKSTEGKGNKYEALHHQVLLLLVKHRASMKRFQALRSPAEALGSPLIQQSDELGSYIVARELDCGSKILRSFVAR